MLWQNAFKLNIVLSFTYKPYQFFQYEGDSICNDIKPINRKVFPKKIYYLAIQLLNHCDSFPAHFLHCTNRFQEWVLIYTAISTLTVFSNSEYYMS